VTNDCLVVLLFERSRCALPAACRRIFFTGDVDTIQDVDRATQTDEVLLAAVAEHDEAAFEMLVRRHQDKALRLAYRLLADADAAQDIAQEAFWRVYHHAGRFEPNARFSTWFYRIVVNLCTDHRRRRAHKTVALPSVEPASAPAADPLESAERIARVQSALAALPQRQRTAVILHRYQQLSHRDIAEATGDSVSAVESLLVRAYATLRKNLADLGPAPAGSGPGERINKRNKPDESPR
jgi:RNA polymerase sigma-70 factor (ECF subfamily)